MTDVIVSGDAAQVELLAVRYGARLKKQLKTHAVLEVTGVQLSHLSQDVDVQTLSGDEPVRAMGVTAEAIGADQVRGRAAGGCGGLPAEASAWPSSIRASTRGTRQLRDAVVLSLDFTGATRFRGQDQNGHGTHIAGIIRDIAPGAHIISLKVMGADGSGITSSVLEAFDWVIDNHRQWNIKVINVSLGHPVMESERDDPLCQAVRRATDAGILVTVAAGNNGKLADGRPVIAAVGSPGHARAALTVGALNTRQTPPRSDDVMATYSSRGPTAIDGVLKPDLVAPGNRIVAAVPARSTLAQTYPDQVVGQGARHGDGVERHEHVVGRGGGGGGGAAGSAVDVAGGGEADAAADEQPRGRKRPDRVGRGQPEPAGGGVVGDRTCRYFGGHDDRRGGCDGVAARILSR